MAEPVRSYTAAELAGDGVSKKDLVTFIQENASLQFQADHKMKGALKSVAKTRSKDQLIDAYNQLFETKAFKQAGEDEQAAKAAVAKKEIDDLEEATKKLEVKSDGDVVQETPRYKKTIIKKGDKTNFPRRGDTVAVYYTGKLEDGTVFDSNVVGLKRGKRPQAIKFNVGVGNVIKGWDEALLTMSCGEKAELIIEPIWAYAKKGCEGNKVPIPPNATLHFEVELKGID